MLQSSTKFQLFQLTNFCICACHMVWLHRYHKVIPGLLCSILGVILTYHTFAQLAQIAFNYNNDQQHERTNGISTFLWKRCCEVRVYHTVALNSEWHGSFRSCLECNSNMTFVATFVWIVFSVFAKSDSFLWGGSPSPATPPPPGKLTWISTLISKIHGMAKKAEFLETQFQKENICRLKWKSQIKTVLN